MKPITFLRSLVVVQILAVVLTLALSTWFEAQLPETLRAWQNTRFEDDSPALFVGSAATVLLFLLAHLIGWGGLLARQRWGAWFLLATIPLDWIGNVQLSPDVSTAGESILNDVIHLTTGAVLILAFFTNAFSRTPPEVAGPQQANSLPPPLPPR